MKKAFIFFLFLLAGILLGSVLTEIAERVNFLNFLTWGQSIGIGIPNPISIDLSVIKLTFGFSFHMDLSLLICIIASMICYVKIGKRL